MMHDSLFIDKGGLFFVQSCFQIKFIEEEIRDGYSIIV